MSSGARQSELSAHDVLRSIRRVKTTLQLQEAYDGLMIFLRAAYQQVVVAHATTKVGPDSECSSGGFKAHMQVSSTTVEAAQQGVLQLRQLSLLCGAFCRRVEHVLRTTYTYADVDDASSRGVTAVHVSAYMAHLTEELLRFNTPAVNQLVAAASQTNALLVSASPVECVLSYGVGDLCDYRLCRRRRARSYLQQLLAQPQWSTAAIAQVIISLNETYATPVDTFSMCTTDEGVQTTCVVTPLRDPISQTVIRIPARGEKCVHLELFDVESFVQATQQRSFHTVDVGAPCPLCSREVLLSSIRVDRLALDAMRSYEKVVAAAALSSSSSSTPPPPLSADCALEWDTGTNTVKVVHDKRGSANGESAVGDDMEESARPPRESREDTTEVVIKKRRIEIGGHVLYAD